MRLVFVVLLLVNMVVLGWHLLRPKVEEKATVAVMPAANSGAKKLILISEVDEDARQALRTERKRGKEQAEPVCTIAGPFADPDRGAVVRERLLALGVESNLQAFEIDAGESYWVYLPPEPSQQQALRRLHELQAKKVDSYVIPKGDLANGISFGMFTQQPLAEQKQANMRKMGYQAEIKSVARTQKELWLLLSPGQAGKIGDEVWSELISKEKGQEIRQNLCSAVASTGKFL